jgi:hypothetical protein
VFGLPWNGRSASAERAIQVLTLQDTLASQCDLPRLCADRPQVTNEIFAPNAFYGMNAVLKLYAGLPQTYALKAVVPHGMVFNDSYVWRNEANAPVPVVLCYPPYRQRAYASHTTKEVILSASPFLYAAEVLKTQPRPERRGTIFFPAHSTHWSTVHADFERLADELTRLEGEYQPVTVCMYWRDFNLGLHVPFQKRGLPVVSAGHIFGDSDFLYRYYHLCSLHRYASGNGVGSHLFYSVKAGCSYFHFDNDELSYETPPEHYSRVFVGEQHEYPPETAIECALKSLFGEARRLMTEEQLRTVDYYLGASYLRSPRELREQLLHAETLDKFGFVVRVGQSRRFVVATYYRRLVRQVLRLSLSVLRLSRLVLPAQVRTRIRRELARLRKGDHRRN